jgi:hypothetical protein
MFRSLPKRAMIPWLMGLLGPPPPPPRSYFSKSWYGASPPASCAWPWLCGAPAGNRWDSGARRLRTCTARPSMAVLPSCQESD